MSKFLIAAFLSTILLSGCASTKSYVDPKYSGIGYDDIQTVSRDAAIEVTFLRNGKPIQQAQAVAQKNVKDILSNAGYNIVDGSTGGPTFKVTLNNIVDVDAAVAKGFGTGLTFGLAGSTVSDFYKVKIAYSNSSASIVRNYDHALHSTVGNAKPPVANTVGVTPAEAFYGVVEDVMLQFLKDLQSGRAGRPVASVVSTQRVVG